VISEQGLHIIDFHPDAIRCNEGAVAEYNRLRLTNSDGLPPLEGVNKKPPLAKIFGPVRRKVTGVAIPAEVAPQSAEVSAIVQRV
jgi:hypothetical protein